MVSGGYTMNAEESDVWGVEIWSRRSRQDVVRRCSSVNRETCIDTLCASLKDIDGDAGPLKRL